MINQFVMNAITHKVLKSLAGRGGKGNFCLEAASMYLFVSNLNCKCSVPPKNQESKYKFSNQK